MYLKAQKHLTKYVELPVEGLRTGVRFPPAPPTPKPQPETVGCGVKHKVAKWPRYALLHDGTHFVFTGVLC
jgi:hypothetical protein